ncbi:MAG TPA: FHA domain-containing protein [Actinopolymorphaceae bacterium]|nr:FHA domain-containing protein [Actinopolymorphaceae bacterium]
MGAGPVLRFGNDRHPLHRAITVIGRGVGDPRAVPEVDLGGIDRQHVVSRRHAQATCDGAAVFLRDLGSTNGTLVNGEPVGPGSVVRLDHGDRISFGGVQAIFEENGPWPDGLTPVWESGGDHPAEQTLPGPRAQPLNGPYPGQ